MSAEKTIPCSPPSCVSDRMEKMRFEPWESIRLQGRAAKYFYFVRNGVVGEFRVLNNSKQLLLSKRSNGELFGREELENHVERSASLISLSETIIHRGDEKDLEHFHEHQNQFGQWDRRSDRIRKNYREKIDEVMTYTLEERLTLELLDLAELLGRRVVDGIELTIPITRTDMSKILGCTVESVSRIFSEWTDEGFISTSHKIITILKPKKLMVKAPQGYSYPRLRQWSKSTRAVEK